MPWPVTATRTVYENAWIRVREDAVVRPDGSPGTYGVVSLHHEAVFVVALTRDEEVVLIEVDRHTVGLSLEVPSGGTDGQEPLVAAARELREETGLVAGGLQVIARMSSLNGICEAPGQVVLATGVHDPGEGGLPDEQALEGIRSVRTVPWAELVRLIGSGAITDNESVAAIGYAAAHLGRLG